MKVFGELSRSLIILHTKQNFKRKNDQREKGNSAPELNNTKNISGICLYIAIYPQPSCPSFTVQPAEVPALLSYTLYSSGSKPFYDLYLNTGPFILVSKCGLSRRADWEHHVSYAPLTRSRRYSNVHTSNYNGKPRRFQG
jgi:hypothetical protein